MFNVHASLNDVAKQEVYKVFLLSISGIDDEWIQMHRSNPSSLFFG